MRGRFARWSAWAVGACGAALGLAGVVYAAIPAPGGVIHGCYAKSNGSLRVIDPEVESCAHKELAISWNQTGPQGPEGIPGNLALAGQSCPIGQFVTGFDDVGEVTCSPGLAPPATIQSGWHFDLETGEFHFGLPQPGSDFHFAPGVGTPVFHPASGAGVQYLPQVPLGMAYLVPVQPDGFTPAINGTLDRDDSVYVRTAEGNVFLVGNVDRLSSGAWVQFDYQRVP